MKWYERLALFLEKRGRYRAINRTTYTPAGVAVSSPYLDRWYIIRTKRFGLYLHRFWTSDEDGVHDHPWNNFSWVLKGGFWELLPDGQRLWRKPGYKKYRHAEEFHRIELEDGTGGAVWTIFGRFKRRRKWGFWEKDGWKPVMDRRGD